MLNVSQNFLIIDAKVTLNWEYEISKHSILFIWIPESNFFWNNFKRVPAKGRIERIAKGSFFNAKLKVLSLKGLKTVCVFKKTVYNVKVKNMDSAIQLIKHSKINNRQQAQKEIASLFFNVKGRSMQTKYQTINPKTKNPTIKNILPIQ
jgi:hypothetical protein